MEYILLTLVMFLGVAYLLTDGLKLTKKKPDKEEDLGPCDSECGDDISKEYKCVNGRKMKKKYWYDTGTKFTPSGW